MTLKISHRRNLDVNGVVGVSAWAEKLPSSIGMSLLGVEARSKPVGKFSKVGTLPPAPHEIWFVGSVCRYCEPKSPEISARSVVNVNL
ncbi:hypothetical protein [Muribaculum intestinale]|uniref:Uncharacterized protein n=1 Tax=Muribaculum intestinale TaxID=1796646 RepID=A0A4S2FQ77_9BACT|nr:hypothetical protein [Muribaculum intestinale]MYM13232.1 hypothetical protein [Muribaculum intestinale]TGY71284.1 hypothetical protein E5333_11625 [Muribaculum intestinale]